jgi:hypothetical protein
MDNGYFGYITKTEIKIHIHTIEKNIKIHWNRDEKML